MMQKSTDLDQFDLRFLFSILFRRKWFMILPVIIITVGTAVGSLQLTPRYLSSSVIWIDRPSQVSQELTRLIGADGRYRGPEERQRELAALRNEILSQAYLYQVVEKLNLDKDSAVNAMAAAAAFEQPGLDPAQLALRILAENLRGQITVDFVGADQIRLSIQSHDPVLARDMVNTLAEVMESERTKYELSRILDNQSFADLQLQKTEFEYREAVDSLTAAQARLSQLQLPENISSLENRRQILSGIDKADLDRRDFSSRAEEKKSELSAQGIGNVKLAVTARVTRIRSDIDSQHITLGEMTSKYAWGEQNIVNITIKLNDNLTALEEGIRQAVDSQFASYADDQRSPYKKYFVLVANRDIASSKATRLRHALEAINAQLDKVPQLQAEISELERHVEDTRRYMDAFRSEEATVGLLTELAKDRTRYRIIEPALVPLKPVWPDKRRMVLIAFVLALVVGGVAVVAVELVDNSFRRPEELESYLDMPILAAIPRIEKFRIRR